MNAINTFNLVIGIGWLLMALLDLILQQPTAWYVSMLMCLALAFNHIHDYVVGKSA